MKKLLTLGIVLLVFLISCGTEKKADVQAEGEAIMQDTVAVDTSAVDTSAAELEE
jgi:hypothetical protein